MKLRSSISIFSVLFGFCAYAAKINVAVISLAKIYPEEPKPESEEENIFVDGEELPPLEHAQNIECKTPITDRAFLFQDGKARNLLGGQNAENALKIENDLKRFIAKANQEALDIAEGRAKWGLHQTLSRDLSLANQLIHAQVLAKDVTISQFAWDPALLGFVNFDRKLLQEKIRMIEQNNKEALYRPDLRLEAALSDFIKKSMIESDAKDTVKLIVDWNIPLHLEDIYETILNSSPKLNSRDAAEVRKLAETYYRLNQDVFKKVTGTHYSDVIFVVSAQRSLPEGQDLGEETTVDRWYSDLKTGARAPRNIIMVSDLKITQVNQGPDARGSAKVIRRGQLNPLANYSSSFVSVAAPSTFTLRGNLNGRKNDHPWTIEHAGVAKSVVASKLALIVQSIKGKRRATIAEIMNEFEKDCTTVPQYSTKISEGKVFLPNFGLAADAKAVDEFIPRKNQASLEM